MEIFKGDNCRQLTLIIDNITILQRLSTVMGSLKLRKFGLEFAVGWSNSFQSYYYRFRVVQFISDHKSLQLLYLSFKYQTRNISRDKGQSILFD